MLKKFLATTLFVGNLLIAGNINLNLADSFNSNSNWEINMRKDGTYYLMLPMDINYSILQNSIPVGDSNARIWVYRWYQKHELINADFGINVLGVVEITKDNITYWIWNGSWQKFSTYSDFKDKLKQLANDITDDNKKNIFVNSYVKSFDKIDKNKLYLIKVDNMDLDINISFPSINKIGTNDTNSSGSSGLQLPPSPPSIN